MTKAAATRAIRQRIHHALLRHGWLVRKVKGEPHGWPNSQAFWTPAYIRRLGFRPATVVDVGVGPGTPDIYEAFPDSFLALVEPLDEFSAAARGILKHRSGVLIQAALAESEGTRTLLVEPGALQRSSLYSYDPASKSHNAGATIAREVPVTTLDTLLRNHAWQAPFGLKMDVQGAELEIIRGGARFLEQTEFVIAEVNVIERYPGSYTFAEFIAAMDRAGFRVCDVLDIVRTPSTEVKFLDLVFGKKAK
ncbi:MAG TPA: FkbM family methyltransferase [Candidatus Solibacter sp.]|nr:FkbM family methyltransferase [Candidatus Solibacter sp.]